jgi:ABC-2 type transport system ATP-binding protein
MGVVEVEGLGKRYRDRWTVQDVSFSVEEGEVFGLLGPNGAGKTTTVECIGGLRARDAGSVRVDGLDPGRHPPELRRTLGMQLQESTLPALMTVRQALALFAGFYPNPVDTYELTERLGLGSKVDTRFEQLSGGQKQRLAVALALVGRPRVAVLDELTTGLDPGARREVWALLEELRADGTTLVLVSHFMEEVERLCDRVAVMRRGRLVTVAPPRSLAGRLVTSHRISFSPVEASTGEPVDAAARAALAAELRERPGVTAVDDEDDRMGVRGSAEAVDEVVAVVARRGLVPRGVHTVRGSLDDAYLALVEEGVDP